MVLEVLGVVLEVPGPTWYVRVVAPKGLTGVTCMTFTFLCF